MKLGPNDCLCTPAWLHGIVAASLGPIALDPCASRVSTVVAKACCYGPHAGGQDGLLIDWPRAELTDGPVFVNPPYGRGHLRSWARKCSEEAARGAEVVLLVPCSPSTVWWRSCLPNVRAIAYLSERVRFDGGAHGSGMFDSAVLYWGTNVYKFADGFAPFADVRILRT